MNKIFVLVGASGSGKTRLVNDANLSSKKIVTTTTRRKRVGEINGIDYHFIEESDFINRDFIETDEAYGSFYGTERSEVARKLKQGNVYAILTHNGYLAFKELYGNSVTGVLIKSSKADLLTMLKVRGEENVDQRMLEVSDMNNIESCYDYILENKFNYFDQTLEEFLKIIHKED